MGNKGAFINITGKDITPKFVTYEAVDHPKIKPMAYANYQNLFFQKKKRKEQKTIIIIITTIIRYLRVEINYYL